MFKESIARRYSSALFGLAKQSGEVAQTAASMDAFVDVLRKDPGVAEFFYSPVVDRDGKQRVIADSLSGRLSELVVNFLVLLVRKRRENIAVFVARQLHDLIDSEAGRHSAVIQTAKILTPDELASLSGRLSRVYRQTLITEQKVSPELLGGVVVQVGDLYVDASIAGRLEDVRRQLLEASQDSGKASRAAGARNGSPAQPGS